MENLTSIEGIGRKIANRIRIGLGAESPEELDDPILLGEMPNIRGIGETRLNSIVKSLTNLVGKEYRSKSWIKDVRHWTDAGIRDFLGEPDETRKNPNYSSGPKMKMYDMERVRGVETSPEFQEWLAASLKRQKKAKQAAKKAAKTRRRKTLQEVEEVEIEIRNAPKSYQHLAVQSYNGRQRNRRGPEPHRREVSHDSDQGFLDRITVNEIRHNWIRLNNRSYEGFLTYLEGQVGKTEAYYRLKERVLEAIKDECPHLSRECDRQIAESKKKKNTPDRGIDRISQRKHSRGS